ncbi:NAD(P)H-binding protein [Winogradskyella alexanderae]|uniref:NAD(P)H-binding protein n=1 Tax=Winogradskyella alexanderae TaxID=2877123 RepID=A0ABS7XN28_9FLAO|nr:NAD(P)H-binding protein [Winogradskyella alexanderae]MCA0131404.1 NAD(P)H-binding protein [Winogradskyella alexanderae]
MIKQISIIGCGWLGLPLATLLVDNGYSIKGSTTSSDKLEQIRKKAVSPFLVELNEMEIVGDIDGFLEGSDLVIINIPPGLRKSPNKNHVTEIDLLARAIEKNAIKHVIYISSTSVFKDEENIPLINEVSVPNNYEGARQLIEIEELLSNNYSFLTTIIRFGGLIDDNRHPGNFLSGRINIANPKAPINLIHKEDCIAIISRVIDKSLFNVKLNATYPSHPTRQSYYTSYCKSKALPLPTFETTGTNKGKIIDSSKLMQLLSYKFKHAV